jgi:hypothetical protein
VLALALWLRAPETLPGRPRRVLHIDAEAQRGGDSQVE